MTNQFIRPLCPTRRRPVLCVFGVALIFTAGGLAGGLTAHFLHGNALLLAKEIAKTEISRAADLQIEVDKATAALTAEQRKNWELITRLDAARQPLADIAELTTAVRKLMPIFTLQSQKRKTPMPAKPKIHKTNQKKELRMLPAPKPAPMPDKKNKRETQLRMIPLPKPAPIHAEEKSWPQQMTAAHNAVRAAVGVPPLTWDDNLSRDAGQWAMHLAQTGCGFVHSGMAHGENLFKTSGDPEPTVDDIVGAWAAERNYYDYASNSCALGKMCGHYTQLVWKNTGGLGCAVAICTGGKGYISVCEYKEAGNVAGEKPY